MGFCSHWLTEYTCQIEVHSFTRSWDNRGYSKNWAVPGYAQAHFLPNFNGLFFALAHWIYLPNLKFVALYVPEIIGVLQKFGQSLDSPTLPILSNFKGFLFAWTLWIYLPNLKFVALPIPEIIGVLKKIWAVPGYAHAPFSPKCFMGLCSDGLCECQALHIFHTVSSGVAYDLRAPGYI